ncbi:MAG TPA: EF-P beta-lysylation protein EpmB [Gammaproteobacteria bacterium]|nr:EF-P beta-lysylation protein EpmB [Gammaproteobacteria bacterium]
MIPRTTNRQQPAAWQEQLGCCITDVETLWSRLRLPPELLPAARAAARQFGLRVPPAFVARMRPGDPEDPLLRQVLPLGAELETVPGFVADPLREAQAMPVPGLLHKYRGRVLLTLTGACAVHCRYCFRRHFPYTQANPGHAHWPATLAYIRADSSIHEVIFSGGDPLSLSDTRLSAMAAELDAIPHLDSLRLHTRLPVVLPERVDDCLIEWLSVRRLHPVLVIHCNHPRELDGDVAAALERLRHAGVTLLNQSVLLAGVNDRPEILEALSRQLFDCGVLPYYLHQLDPVQGAAHFGVDDRHARELEKQLRNRLPGYLVPRLVREQAGEAAKQPL